MTADIWQSFRSLPRWVQVWVAVVLVPVNLISVGFWAMPGGILIAFLAVGGMAPNLILMIAQRGFSRAMVWSHLVLWIPLVGIIWSLISGGTAGGIWLIYLWVLLVVDVISLMFDIPDCVAWLRGDRAVAGREYGPRN